MASEHDQVVQFLRDKGAFGGKSASFWTERGRVGMSLAQVQDLYKDFEGGGSGQSQPTPQSGGSSAPTPATAALAESSAPSSTSQAPPAAAVAGLTGAGPMAPGPIQPQVEGGGGGEVSLPGAGALRQNLGQRIPPSLMSALVGLKRVY